MGKEGPQLKPWGQTSRGAVALVSAARLDALPHRPTQAQAVGHAVGLMTGIQRLSMNEQPMGFDVALQYKSSIATFTLSYLPLRGAQDWLVWCSFNRSHLIHSWEADVGRSCPKWRLCCRLPALPHSLPLGWSCAFLPRNSRAIPKQHCMGIVFSKDTWLIHSHSLMAVRNHAGQGKRGPGL